MIRAVSPLTSSAHFLQTPPTNAHYQKLDEDEIQRQLDFSNAMNFEMNAHGKKEEKKVYTHSNKRAADGEHLIYSEMQEVDAPPTAFDRPNGAV